MSDHGYGPYTRGCRCEVCKQAKADYMRERRAAGRAKAQKHTATPLGVWSRKSIRMVGATRYIAPNVTHGTRYTYEEHGCRCYPCTNARSTLAHKRKDGAA